MTPLQLDDLRATVEGPVLAPDDHGFAAEVAGVNLAATCSPDVVVGVASESDVVEAVRFAGAHGLRLHVQATGHGAHGHLKGGLLISTRRLAEVAVDPVARIAAVGAGAPWSTVLQLAVRHGLAPISGSSTHVGAVGYTLGGGLGPLARSHGFSSDYVRSFRVVTADGEPRTASAIENPDLFWALRGGKAGFGVVTGMEVALLPLTELYAGSLFFAEEHIETALRGWAEWTTTADDQVSTSVAIVRFPPIDEVPEVFRGKTLLSLRFAFPGDAERGAELAAPLRALAPALLDAVGVLPVAELATIHNDPEQASPSWTTGAMLTAVPAEFVDALLARVGPTVSPPVVAVELRHLGNRTSVDVAEGSAVGGRDGAFILDVVALTPPGTDPSLLPGFWSGLTAAIEPWLAPVTTINFAGHPGPAEFARSWSPEQFARLTEIARRYDPSGLLLRA